MPHYKDLDNKLHFLDSEEYEHMLPDGCIAITEVEAEELAPKAAPADLIMQQIYTLEHSITPRRLRDAMLTDSGKEWLVDIESQLDILRAQLSK